MACFNNCDYIDEKMPDVRSGEKIGGDGVVDDRYFYYTVGGLKEEAEIKKKKTVPQQTLEVLREIRDLLANLHSQQKTI